MTWKTAGSGSACSSSATSAVRVSVRGSVFTDNKVIVEHSGEHYGQLVVYYRVAGLVPPESRPKKQATETPEE